MEGRTSSLASCPSLQPASPLQPHLHFHGFREDSNLREAFSKQGTDLQRCSLQIQYAGPRVRHRAGPFTGSYAIRTIQLELTCLVWILIGCQILQLNFTQPRTFSPSRCHLPDLLLTRLQTSQSRQNVSGPNISTSIRPLIAYDGWTGI